jgi:hypothetical protein
MKSQTKLMLLAALLLPGGMLLLLIPPAKMVWQLGVLHITKKAA